MKIEYVTKEEFSKSGAAVLFADDLYAQVFGICIYNDKPYKVSWSSDLIQLDIIELKKDIFFLGIDQTSIIYDFSLDRHLLQIRLEDLYTYYTTTRIVGKTLFIFCQLRYFIVDLDTYNVIQTGSFPDVFEECEIMSDKMKVDCMCGCHCEIAFTPPVSRNLLFSLSGNTALPNIQNPKNVKTASPS